MSSPIADGTYNIRNVYFPGFVINLSGGLPNAAINAWESGTSHNLRWIVKNVGHNQITLENVTARGYYASVVAYSKGAPALASLNPTYWTVKEVSKGVYNLGAQGHLLELFKSGNNSTICLGPLVDSFPPQHQQWTFERICN